MSFSPSQREALLRELEANGDPAYKAFHEKLIPGVTMAYGVRLPKLRALAKQVIRRDPAGFLAAWNPTAYEEVLLQGLVIAGMEVPMEERLPAVSRFLPLIDNWAVCDSFCSTFRFRSSEEKEAMWNYLQPLFEDSREFFARFAFVMLLEHFAEPPYREAGLSLLGKAKSESYYVQMAQAWAVSVFYVKFPRETLALLQSKTLPPFVQNKGIQKIRESYRVSKEEKERLLSYKTEPSGGKRGKKETPKPNPKHGKAKNGKSEKR